MCSHGHWHVSLWAVSVSSWGQAGTSVGVATFLLELAQLVPEVGWLGGGGTAMSTLRPPWIGAAKVFASWGLSQITQQGATQWIWCVVCELRMAPLAWPDCHLGHFRLFQCHRTSAGGVCVCAHRLLGFLDALGISMPSDFIQALPVCSLEQGGGLGSSLLHQRSLGNERVWMSSRAMLEEG